MARILGGNVLVRHPSECANRDAPDLQTDEGQENASALVGHALRELDDEKRALYARLLANRCNTSIDHTWYPTALKLVQQIEPAHVAILRVLRERKRLFPNERETTTRVLALELHLNDIEDLRESLAAENSGFDQPFRNEAEWDAALGGAQTANTDAYRIVAAKHAEVGPGCPRPRLVSGVSRPGQPDPRSSQDADQ